MMNHCVVVVVFFIWVIGIETNANNIRACNAELELESFEVKALADAETMLTVKENESIFDTFFANSVHLDTLQINPRTEETEDEEEEVTPPPPTTTPTTTNLPPMYPSKL